MNAITPIGITNWRNVYQPFGIKDADCSGHIYCIGKTGSGKSTLLLRMTIAAIEQGKGVGIIDPHGDMSEEVLNHIPAARVQDVIYFNAGDLGYPIAFNPLYNVQDEERYQVIATVVLAFKKAWADSWGPRLEHILRNTLLSLSYYSKSTLLDIAPMLTDPSFRKQVLYAVPVNSIHQFWQKEFEPLTPHLRNEFIAPVLNKVGLLTVHPILKNILGQQHSTIDIAGIMNGGKIFIANFSKGVLGEAGTQLLGSLLVTQFQAAAWGRGRQPMDTRIPFRLFIDEVHSFVTLSFIDVLSEARKYGLCLFLTHQYIDQLDERIRLAIFGNVGTVISFRIGAADAVVLEEEFSPVFSVEDLLNLPQYHIYIKLLIDGTTSKPFSAITLPLPAAKELYKDAIVKRSRENYATTIEDVEHDVRRVIPETDTTVQLSLL